MRKRAGLLLLMCSFVAGARGQSSQDILAKLGHPESIVYNAKIITVDNDSFTSNIGTITSAMAIREEKILAVGDNDEIRALAGPPHPLDGSQGEDGSTRLRCGP